MFMQHSNAQMNLTITKEDLKVDEANDLYEEPLLTGARVTVYFKNNNYRFNKECIITNIEAGKAICYLNPDDLKYYGNYSYQVVVEYANGSTIKSYVDDIYVYEALDLDENFKDKDMDDDKDGTEEV